MKPLAVCFLTATLLFCHLLRANCQSQALRFLGQEPFTAYVSHGASPGQVLYRLLAVVSDSYSNTVTYSLVRPDPTHVALFAVATTGELSITAWIPSSHSEYHLVVRASSPGATVDANFSVIAVSQAITTPRFEHERFVTVVSENRPGNTSVTIVRAFSLDSHGNKNTVGNYTIIRGNENGALCIRQQTGILSTSKPLDREKISMYFLTVRYTDSTGYVEAQVQVSVGDVNDNPPTLSEALYNFTVAETLSQNSIFGLVSAFDPDSGSNGQYVYSLSGLSAEVFSIDSSGQITTQRPLDYEQQTQYQVNVVTTDMGTLRLTASAVVLVNVLNIDDECPLFSGSLYAMEIPYNDMNFPPPLKLILSVMAIDPDKIAPVRYAILSGNDDGVFSLDTTSGSIFLVNNSIGVRGQYELNISASDANCHNKSSIRVVIGIGTTNDHTPTLNKTTCAAKLFENPSPNALVTTLQATDEDFGPGGHVQFAILRGIGEFDLFMVDPESGEIRTANSSKGFDRERTSGFKIGVVATDSGFRQDFCLVEIVLLDLNDNAPLFEVPVYRVSLKMDAAIGDEVIQVLAYDPDQGLNGMVMYSITTPAGCSFTINSTTGSISVSGTVNEAIAGFCHINVTATDQGSEQRSGFALVNITLFHSSQVLPMFMQELYNTSIHENYPTLPSTFLDVHVNSGMSVTYTIANGLSYHSNGESTFGIAPTSGNIFVNSVASKGVDYESLYPGPYYFRLLVTATLSSGLFSVVPVTVTVTDQNDNFPQFPVDSVTSSIREMEPVFSFVSIVQAMDADQGTNGTIIYTISGNLFGVDANGTISLLADNLTATGMPHEISVDAYNPNFKMHADRIRVTVNVEDINNNPPAFSNALYTFAINETQPVYSQIAELPASDPDHSDQDKLIFTIIYGNQEGVFQIMANKQTGILLLSQRLDYESRTEYELTVQVSDGIHTSTANVTISVEDNDDEPPQFSQSNYHGKITENAVAGTSVLQVSATDVDTAQIQFQLTGSALERLNVADNGTVSVSGSIDREQFLPNGELVFVAFAYGGSLDAATITINIADVNDQVPTLLQSPFNGLVPENTDPGTDGLFTVQVSASDHDAGLNGTISYSLLSGEENGFQIDAISGIVSAHRRFDREARQFYTLTVQAEDQGTPLRLSSTANIIVEIGDENDNSPSWRYPYMFTRVFENTTVGNAIFRLPAIDPDKGNNASVIFTNSSNMGELFSLNSTTGEVIVNGLLDYEDQQQSKQFSFNFTIRDDGNPPRINSERGVLVIEILDTNDNRPELSETYLNISLQESTSPGTVLTGFSASDADAGSNGKVSFSIKSGNIQEAFNISVNGDSRASVIVATPLDFETIADYVLTIEAKDGGYPSLSTTAMLNITIADVNDEAPVFSQGVYYATIREESPPVTGFLQVSATDPDSDDLPGGRVSFYQLVSGNDQGKFNFNNASLSAIGSLDREEQAQYTLTIIAVDNDPEQPLTGTATIIIDIMDINDNNSSNGGHLEVVISARDGMVPSEDLGMVYFSDPDDDDQFQNCTIVGGDSQLFKVFSNCSLSAKQNTMGKGVYNLTVQGNDGVHDPVISTVTVRVYHFNPNLLLSESLLIFTLNASGSFYLDSIGPTTLLSRLSSTLQRNISQFINVSVQQGLHNPDSTVDVAIAVQETSGQFVTPTRLIHELFVARQQLQFGSVELFSLATDPCITEPCFNKAQCKAKKTIRGTGNRLASRKTILYSPMVELSYECICLPGSAGKHCEINYNDCYSNPCQYGAPCIDGLQDFFCQCPSGTSGKDCSINVDECLSNPCHNGASCRNGFGAPICECTPGYYGNLCQYSYFRVSQQCDSNPCQNGGTCSPGRDTFTCQCSMMYFGKTCSSQVIFQGGCVSTPCYNGSVCMETINSTACICSVGFTGPLCRFPLDNCELKPCRNGATCETGLYGSYLCVCPPGFTGQDCTEPVPACSSNPCQNGGTCNEGNGTFTCICPKEFTGDHCQTTINPPDLCSASICTSTNGNCTSSQDGYSCTCLPVFSGEDCSINSPPSSPCGSNPCQHGGSCTNTSSTYSCSCPSGFTGQDCEININDCSSASTCINGGTCVDGIMGYTCSCMNGFAGRKCEVHCPLGHIGDRCQTDINYCLDTSCQNGGTCIEQVEGFSCLCPPRFIGPVCNISNDCSQSICHNQGTCMDSPSLGHTCQCDSQLDGSDCELLTVSFQGTTSLPSYRAYKSLDVGGHAALKFEFTTLSTSGLLLLNTQYQQGHSRDIISVEMVNSQLKVLFSLGSEQVTAITVLSSSLNVSDGQWHTVELEVVEKTISVKLDYCTMLDEASQLLTVDCSISATATSNYSFLDLGLPLWLGGAPANTASFLPIQSQGISACIRNVYINGDLLDLDSHVADLEQRSQRGCPEVDTCSMSNCGRGTCVDRYNHHLCVCPLLLTGDTCDEATESVTFGGNNYAQFTLLNKGRSRRQTDPTSSTSTISSFQELIALRFRAADSSGVLLLLQGNNTSGEHLRLSMSSGQLLLSINLGGSTDTVMASGTLLSDMQWHTVNINRTGRVASIAVDSLPNMSLSLAGPSVTLEYSINGIFVGGRPRPGGQVADGYHGCLEDIRLNQNSLPLLEPNDFAHVTFVGSSATRGCSVGPCFPNPCTPGNCTEGSNGTSFICICPDGRNQTTQCGPGVTEPPIRPIAIAAAVAILALLLLVAMLTGLLIMIWRVKKSKRYKISESRTNPKEQYEIHENVYSYHVEGGGEADTNIDDNGDGPVAEVSIHDLSSGGASPVSSVTTLEKARMLQEETSPPYPRATTPDIDCFIEDRVNVANKHISDLDSIREYKDEGMGSPSGSLSSLCPSSDEEPYSIARLRQAGKDFQRVADLLEPVLTDLDYESGSDYKH